jgi:hypothetical protein
MSQHRREKTGLFPWLAGGLLVIVFGAIFVNLFGQARQSVKFGTDEWKKRDIVEFPGLEEASKLDSARRSAVIVKANKELCPCRCGYTVATCLHDDANCPERTKNLERVKAYARESIEKRG